MPEGSVVRVLAGKEKGRLFLVLGTENGRIQIADGRHRKVTCPKLKNPKHLLKTEETVLPDPLTNRSVWNILKTVR